MATPMTDTHDKQSKKPDFGIRPARMSEYIGQDQVKANLLTYIAAAMKRGEALDHALIYGPAGIGKTTLAQIIAYEMGNQITIASGPTLTKPGDLAGILGELQEGQVIFIDEVHAMPMKVEETLYSAMEDFRLDMIIGEKGNTNTISVNLPRFTLVGATTRPGAVSTPLKRRFPIKLHLDFFEPEDLVRVVMRTSEVHGLVIDEDSALEIARRGRGTPSITNNLLSRVRDFAQVHTNGYVNKMILYQAFDAMQLDEYGLEHPERKLLGIILNKFKGGPVGLSTLATAMAEDENAIEDMYEPYLIRQGLLERQARGRVITRRGKLHVQLIEMKKSLGKGLNTDWQEGE